MKLLCRKCNVYYEDPELKFCSKCGTTLEEVNICPKCHTENELDFVFCAKCGTKLNENSTIVTASNRDLSPSPTATPVTPTKLNEKPKEYTGSINNDQYNNTSKRDAQNDGIFGNPTITIMLIVLAIVGLTVLAIPSK